MIVQTKRELPANTPNPDSKKRAPAIRNAGPVMAQCRVRFRNQLTAQPIATAKQIVVAEDAWGRTASWGIPVAFDCDSQNHAEKRPIAPMCHHLPVPGWRPSFVPSIVLLPRQWRAALKRAVRIRKDT